LTCGHAFHAVCLDPWLTSRRACCPLCKADYYTPKPRPPAAEPGDATTPGTITTVTAANDTRRLNSPSMPGPTWIGIRGQGRVMIPRRFTVTNQGEEVQQTTRRATNQRQPAEGGRNFGFFGRSRQQQPSSQPQQTTTTPVSPMTQTQSRTTQPSSTQANEGGALASVRSAFSGFRLPRRGNNSDTSGANSQVTPSTLEAGVRAS
jgi:hypothetical protein